MHITDLHVGMKDQGWLWPELKHHLFDDLRKQKSRTSKIDFVIFSGDLVQKGSVEEFEKLDVIISEIWSTFRELGCNPTLIHIPGNHDLVRPDIDDPSFLALSSWWEKEGVRDNFFAGKYNYQHSIRTIFNNYTNWADRLSKQGVIPVPSELSGIFPGDKSCVLEINNARVGIVGLNSTWLQFLPGNQHGKLCVDTRQLQAVTRNDARKWCVANDINIITTHHPLDWLHKHSQSSWISDICPDGRFDVHLYGHMHESDFSSKASFGSAQRVSLQGSSLFGLEYIENNHAKRYNGYSICQFSQIEGRRKLKIWPRALRQLGSGEYALGPDGAFKLEEDNSVLAFDRESVDRDVKKKTLEELGKSPALRGAQALSTQSILAKFKYFLPKSNAHSSIRTLELEEVQRRLNSNRFCWIVSEWGMAGDEFLHQVLATGGQDPTSCFRLDASDYRGRGTFLEDIRERYEVSFEKLCDALEEHGSSCLLIDDIPVNTQQTFGEQSIEAEFEDIISIALQYCPNIVVILRCDTASSLVGDKVVRLKNLDEADLMVYVSSFGDLYAENCNENSIRKLHQLTDGVPLEVDTALKSLSIVPLTQLIGMSSDILLQNASGKLTATPKSFRKSLEFLRNKSEGDSNSELELLKVLAIFPKGEQLVRIRRFRLNKNFYISHASELQRLGLIDTMTSRSADLGSSQEATRTLFAPKMIRDEIISSMNSKELQLLNRRAATLYFGDEWESGIFKPPPTYDFDNPHCENADIINANLIITRLLLDAMEFGGERELNASLGLAITYSHALMRGDHFGGVVTFLDDFLRMAPEASADGRRAQLELLLARGLRMIGAHDRSIKIIERIDFQDLTNNNKQHALLNLMLAYEKVGDHDAVQKLCSDLVSINRNNSLAWQARSILLRLQDASAERAKKLRTLESHCRRNGARSVANEIALIRVNEDDLNVDQIAAILAPVISSTSDKDDFYVRLRALVRIARISLDEKNMLDTIELSSIVMAYHFSFNERLGSLFDQCHSLLWRHFEHKQDYDNLLTLFRHSSLYWRLRGRTDQEEKYLTEPISRAIVSTERQGLTRRKEIDYFNMRIKEVVASKTSGLIEQT